MDISSRQLATRIYTVLGTAHEQLRIWRVITAETEVNSSQHDRVLELKLFWPCDMDPSVI